MDIGEIIGVGLFSVAGFGMLIFSLKAFITGVRTNSWGGPLLMLLFSLVFSGGVVFMIIDDVNKIMESQPSLEDTGKRIVLPGSDAKSEAVIDASDSSTTYYITVSWVEPKSGKQYQFKSDAYTDDPSGQLSAIRLIHVYADSADYSRYVMHVAMLLPMIDAPPVSEDDSPKDNPGEKIFMMVFMGFVCFASGFVFLYVNASGVISGVKTRAKVVDLVAGKGGTGTVYYPVVEFKTLKGQTIHTQLDGGSNIPSHQTGDEMDIFYQYHNPKQIVSPEAGFIIFFLVLIHIGLMLWAGALYFYTT